ncbi:MAG: hypothetical protein ABJB33_08960 [Gemmatimonadota bacterium]
MIPCSACFLIALGAKEFGTARVALAALSGNIRAARGRGVSADVHEVMRGGLAAIEARLG